MKLFRSAEQRKFDRIVRSLPLRSPIFLPTKKVPLNQAIVGLERVKSLYDRDLSTVHRPRLEALKRRYSNLERCFVIGNGPSLNHTDLSLLKNEVTFAVNGFFLKASELDWTPTFYVVEDHLVAEDRMSEINAFTGPTKLFPVNLAYCFGDSDDTVFFDHRPRPSYPNGFDFSTDSATVTYAGCTVTFTCLQLAFYLGFRQIYLVGVDADYSIPDDVAKSASYGVEVLDMASDDPNHFDPDYFGKGYRWHDPQLSKMLEAYEEAKKVTRSVGVNIFNAGVGGKLEVFPRVEYQSLFDDQPGAEPHTGTSISSLTEQSLPADPRIAIIDPTCAGDGTATGELKANLLKGWNSELLHVFSSRHGNTSVRGMVNGRLINSSRISEPKFRSLIDEFSPNCIIYRPVPENLTLHTFAMNYLRSSTTPLAVWIMDDWPERMRLTEDGQFPKFDRDLRWLLERANVRLCISDPMKRAFRERYGMDFIPLANGIDPQEWSLSSASTSPHFTLRYAGALADNMGLDSVTRVARVIETMAEKGALIRLEINTKPMWARAARELKSLKSCRITTDSFTSKQYREFLQEADALLIAYNFDERSKSYIGYSLANKLPECLVSGRPLLVHGPSDVATVELVQRNVPEAVVDVPSDSALKDWLLKYQNSPGDRESLADDCRAFGVADFGITDRRKKLQTLVQSAVNLPYETFIHYCERRAKVNLDESALISILTSDKVGSQFTMIDVGAHRGSSMQYFIRRNWTVLAFEPDVENRRQLVNRFAEHDNVTVEHQAVADVPSDAREFYRSPVSDGISSILPFHESHQAAGEVQVTTIAEAVRKHKIDHIDYLKIDVEGLDYSVLKGVPWAEVAPGVILCEFEDTKTQLLGHRWQDMADYLSSKGYTVYVSEWYPITRYGVQHEWRSLRRYPCSLSDPAAWGNLVAFLDPPPLQSLSSALLQLTKPQTTAHHLVYGFIRYQASRVRRLIRLIAEKIRS